MKHADALGHAPEELSPALRTLVAGQWVALELYDPHRLPLRKIAAIGDSAAACFASLRAQGRNPAHFEAIEMHGPF